MCNYWVAAQSCVLKVTELCQVCFISNPFTISCNKKKTESLLNYYEKKLEFNYFFTIMNMGNSQFLKTLLVSCKGKGILFV